LLWQQKEAAPTSVGWSPFLADKVGDGARKSSDFRHALQKEGIFVSEYEMKAAYRESEQERPAWVSPFVMTLPQDMYRKSSSGSTTVIIKLQDRRYRPKVPLKF